MLKIYNTLSRTKETFIPRVAGKVGMYVCGMTVYDYCHIGHARVMVVFDTVARFLRHSGYELTYVRNVTDIDDKIIQRANDNAESFTALTARFITAMHEDEHALSVLPPDIEPKATEAINDMIALIATLIAKGFAYIGSNGDVFYSVNHFASYGQLSGKQLEDLQAGERVDVDQAKRDPLDFVLWKMAKPNEPAWESPWGLGRPGWHIECSAMSTGCLGAHFDIHGGGMDLQFPHHENEIAQSEAATGHKYVNYWMHNGFVRVNEEKMSKSLGNFFTVREVLKRYRPEVIRFFILSSHYRSPLNYSDEQLDDAGVALTRLYTALRDVNNVKLPLLESFKNRFEQAMEDDFNTPVAIAVLFDLARELNKAKGHDQTHAECLAATLRFLGGLLGIVQEDAEVFLKGGTVAEVSASVTDNLVNTPLVSEAYIEQQINTRLEAKKAKNWTLADDIRDTLKAQGVILEDSPNGKTTWRRE